MQDGNDHIVGGDINIDRHQANDPCSRPEVRALTPLLEDYLMTNSMVQVNWKPTRHQHGSKSSLLDLYLTNIPERLNNLENVLNTISEHEGVECTVMLKSPCKNVKSMLIRNYQAATFNLMQQMVDDPIERLRSRVPPAPGGGPPGGLKPSACGISASSGGISSSGFSSPGGTCLGKSGLLCFGSSSRPVVPISASRESSLG